MSLTDLSFAAQGALSGLNIADGGRLLGNQNNSSDDSNEFDKLKKRMESDIHKGDFSDALNDLPEASNMTLPPML
jgi:hypothetical protein